MERSISTSDGQQEYIIKQFSYTTADIENSQFSGETPDPFHFTESQPPMEEFSPVVLTVIDGELRVVKDEAPPEAEMPDPDACFFELANEVEDPPDDVA
jgi:hypothetical protein